MHQQDEAAFEAKAEKMLAGQRECPTGRNFLAWTFRYQNITGYHARFDGTFNASPSSKEWFDNKFCATCGMAKGWCECKKTN